MDGIGNLLGPSITDSIRDVKKMEIDTINAGKKAINGVNGGGQSLDSLDLLESLAGNRTVNRTKHVSNVTQSEAAKNRPTPTSNTSVPTKQQNKNADDYDNVIMDGIGNLLGPSITDSIRDVKKMEIDTINAGKKAINGVNGGGKTLLSWTQEFDSLVSINIDEQINA